MAARAAAVTAGPRHTPGPRRATGASCPVRPLQAPAATSAVGSSDHGHPPQHLSPFRARRVSRPPAERSPRLHCPIRRSLPPCVRLRRLKRESVRLSPSDVLLVFQGLSNLVSLAAAVLTENVSMATECSIRWWCSTGFPLPSHKIRTLCPEAKALGHGLLLSLTKLWPSWSLDVPSLFLPRGPWTSCPLGLKHLLLSLAFQWQLVLQVAASRTHPRGLPWLVPALHCSFILTERTGPRQMLSDRWLNKWLH